MGSDGIYAIVYAKNKPMALHKAHQIFRWLSFNERFGLGHGNDRYTIYEATRFDKGGRERADEYFQWKMDDRRKTLTKMVKLMNLHSDDDILADYDFLHYCKRLSQRQGCWVNIYDHWGEGIITQEHYDVSVNKNWYWLEDEELDNFEIKSIMKLPAWWIKAYIKC